MRPSAWRRSIGRSTTAVRPRAERLSALWRGTICDFRSAQPVASPSSTSADSGAAARVVCRPSAARPVTDCPVYHVFAVGESQTRLPTSIATILAIGALYLLMKRGGTERAALLATTSLRRCPWCCTSAGSRRFSACHSCRKRSTRVAHRGLDKDSPHGRNDRQPRWPHSGVRPCSGKASGPISPSDLANERNCSFQRLIASFSKRRNRQCHRNMGLDANQVVWRMAIMRSARCRGDPGCHARRYPAWHAKPRIDPSEPQRGDDVAEANSSA